MKLDARAEAVVDRVLAELDRGVVPWRKPWSTIGEPKSYTGHAYHGINILVLGMSGFNTPVWLTFNKARQLGGSVKKGEHGTPVILWKFIQAEKADGTDRTIPLLRVYTVFNLAQTEGVPEPGWYENQKAMNADECFTPDELCEKIAERYELSGGPKIAFGGERAAYSPAKDLVSMPEPKRFITPAEYYSTLFHELGHSTGHKNRLNRDTLVGHDDFGPGSYSKEELIAEMCAATLLCHAEQDDPRTMANAAAYCNHWLAALRANKDWLVNAGSAGRKAARFIIGDAEEHANEEAA